MKPFTYERATSPADAAAAVVATAGREVHRRRHQPARPDEAADRDADAPGRRQRARRSTASSRRADGGLRIGALVRNTDLAADARVRRDYAVLSRALLAGASGQLRNKATTAGNLLQRTRCPYFYDTNQAVQQAPAGQRLQRDRRLQPAARGDRRERPRASRRIRATWRSRCACSTRRSRPCVPDGRARVIPIADFHRLPGDTPQVENALEPGELITAVTLPKPLGGTHVYRKVRDRASYAFALVSVAAVVQQDGSGPRRARRRRAQAVARRGGRGRACRSGAQAP